MDRYDHIVDAIEESKYLSKLQISELLSSLQSHEDKLNRS